MSNFKQITRACHTLEKRINVVCNSDGSNFENSISNLMYVIDTTPVLEVMLKPYFQCDINYEDVFVEEYDGWRKVLLPDETSNRISFILKFMRTIEEGTLKVSLTGLLYAVYHHKSIDYNYTEFNRKVVVPCLEDLLDEVRYHIEDNLSDDNVEYTNAQIQINIKEINNNGNISLGNKNNQTIGCNGDINI